MRIVPTFETAQLSDIEVQQALVDYIEKQGREVIGAVTINFTHHHVVGSCREYQYTATCRVKEKS